MPPEQAWFGSEGTGLCSLIGKTCTSGLPKRCPGNAVLCFHRGDNDCAVACFHILACHRTADISSSPVFPVLLSVAHNFTGFCATELGLPSPASSAPSGSFCCHKCWSCLPRSEFDSLAFSHRFFWVGFLHLWSLPCVTAATIFIKAFQRSALILVADGSAEVTWCCA